MSASVLDTPSRASGIATDFGAHTWRYDSRFGLAPGDLLIWLAMGYDGSNTDHHVLSGLDALTTSDGVAWDTDLDERWWDASTFGYYEVWMKHRIVGADAASYWATINWSTSDSGGKGTSMFVIRGADSPAFHSVTPTGPFSTLAGTLGPYDYGDGSELFWDSPVGEYHGNLIQAYYDITGMRILGSYLQGHASSRTLVPMGGNTVDQQLFDTDNSVTGLSYNTFDLGLWDFIPGGVTPPEDGIRASHNVRRGRRLSVS